MSPIIEQKGEKFTFPSKYLLFILTVICSIIMVLSYSTSFVGNSISYVAGFLVVPFEKGLSATGYYLSNRAEQIAEIKYLLAENEELKAKVDELTTENILLSQDRYELITLRELYELDNEYSSYDMTGARVIARDNSNWYSTFVINKGEKDGLKVDMNVMADGGLVGRITAVGGHWAKVKSIIEDDSNVSAQVLSNADTLVVSGDLQLYSEGIITFSQLIDKDDQVDVGDKIVTSNISDKFLPGILIGYVDSVHADSNNLTKSGTIKPAVDFEHITDVLVIIKNKQSMEE